MPRHRSELARQLMPMRLYHVYDQKGRVVYVGVTCNGLNTRMSGHRSLARKYRGNSGGPFMQWMFKELEAGRCPDAEFVAVCGDDYLGDERKEIKRLLKQKQPLLNVVCKDEPCPYCGGTGRADDVVRRKAGAK